jgi:hypothetical protein
MAVVDAVRFIEDAVLGEDFVDCFTPTLSGSFSPKTSCRLRVSNVDML